MREEISASGGQEVLFVGHLDREGMIASVDVYARGSEAAVAAPTEFCERGDIIIHNHPSGRLRPSDADVQVSARLAESGIGSALVDNEISQIYVMVEPLIPEARVALKSDRLAEVIGDDGAMSRVLRGFRERSSQVSMLRSVAAAFNDDGVAVAEAGTGVGKSFAYLIPAVAWTAGNRERVVIATATINLQQQLLDHDLPRVQESLGTQVPTALVKGRGNYICHRRLAEQQREADLFDEGDTVRAIAEWAEQSPTGSRSDLPVPVSGEQWARVNSEADSCSASRCPNREKCFILRARQRAAGARILVANHHVVFSDLAVRHAGAGYETTAILPPFHRLIFDEAHNIERAATSFFSRTLSHHAILRQAGRLLRRRGRHRFGILDRLTALEAPVELVSRCEESVEQLRAQADSFNARMVAFVGGGGAGTNWRLTPATAGMFREGAADALFSMQRALLGTAEKLAAVARAIDDRFREDPLFLELVALVRRMEQMGSILESFGEGMDDADHVYWMERRNGPRGAGYVSLAVTPLDIRRLMQEAVFSPYDTVVMTSATLAVNGSFSYWGDRIGLDSGDESVAAASFPSPFAYPERVTLAVPNDAPTPDRPEYTAYLVHLVPRLVNAAGGGVLVLFTSYRQLEEVHQAIAPELEGRGFSCYRQGSEDRARLLDQFRTDLASVLFATDSFWEGIDAPGDTLRLVILCRLPFRVPTDPVQQARSEALERAGGNAFADLSLPQAVMRLKQGFGRLMRRVDDYGAVVVADPRMVRKHYGRVFWNSLPPARPLVAPAEELVEELQRFLASFQAER